MLVSVYVISRRAQWGFNFVSLLRELMCLLASSEEFRGDAAKPFMPSELKVTSESFDMAR